MNNYNVEITSPGKPALIKPLREVETLLRSKLNDTTVDLKLLELDTTGFAYIVMHSTEILLVKVQS